MKSSFFAEVERSGDTWSLFIKSHEDSDEWVMRLYELDELTAYFRSSDVETMKLMKDGETIKVNVFPRLR